MALIRNAREMHLTCVNHVAARDGTMA